MSAGDLFTNKLHAFSLQSCSLRTAAATAKRYFQRGIDHAVPGQAGIFRQLPQGSADQASMSGHARQSGNLPVAGYLTLRNHRDD